MPVLVSCLSYICWRHVTNCSCLCREVEEVGIKQPNVLRQKMSTHHVGLSFLLVTIIPVFLGQSHPVQFLEIGVKDAVKVEP